jgi:anti-sigma factor RsiW
MNKPSLHPDAPCALALPLETLSAWHDTALRQAELRRVGEHVNTCVACQARLAAFDEIAALLRGEPLFEPRPSTWIELRGRIFIESARTRSRLPKVTSWQGLVLLALALLVVLIVARLLTVFLSGHANTIVPAIPAPTSALTSLGNPPRLPRTKPVPLARHAAVAVLRSM